MFTIFHSLSLEEFKNNIKGLVDYYCTKNVNQNLEKFHLMLEAKYELMEILLDNNFETNQISQILSENGYDEEKIIYFTNLLTERKPELLYATLIHQSCEYGETITGFDWLLKLVLGTSELNTLRYPLLQLLLSSTDSNGTQNKLVYDMNKEILLKTIEALEKLDDLL